MKVNKINEALKSYVDYKGLFNTEDGKFVNELHRVRVEMLHQEEKGKAPLIRVPRTLVHQINMIFEEALYQNIGVEPDKVEEESELDAEKEMLNYKRYNSDVIPSLKARGLIASEEKEFSFNQTLQNVLKNTEKYINGDEAAGMEATKGALALLKHQYVGILN